MIDITAQNPVIAPTGPKTLTMRHNDRTAGSIPVWMSAGTANPATQNPETGFRAALAAASGPQPPSQPRPFGFADLLDMVNPLQHIPVVSQLYRDLTGDSIRPVSKIVGGAVFGGPAGAAGGLVNVIAEEETGRDLAGNVVALALRGEKPSYKSDLHKPGSRLETVLAQAEAGAANTAGNRDLPAELLAFAAPEKPAKTAARMLHNDQSRYNG